jgi:hypothetical protein
VVSSTILRDSSTSALGSLVMYWYLVNDISERPWLMTGRVRFVMSCGRVDSIPTPGCFIAVMWSKASCPAIAESSITSVSANLSIRYGVGANQEIFQ